MGNGAALRRQYPRPSSSLPRDWRPRRRVRGDPSRPRACPTIYRTIDDMRFCRIAAFYVMCLGVWAASGYTVAQIKQFIESAIQLKNPDQEVAKTLSKMKLSERMDLDTVEALQGQGAGPKTVAALKALATESESP